MQTHKLKETNRLLDRWVPTAGTCVQIFNKEEGWIGHRLNILSIRVWRNQCALVARTGGDWITLGAARSLPVQVPRNAEELARAARDPLLITAYQYMAEYPDSDLAALLSQAEDFDSVLARPH
jgi:hypothetical protein